MKLSIITINYNNAKGLEKTIKSVVNQTYTDFEYIIIDGGSTDGSVAIIKQNEDKITYWVSEPDKGIYNAMNKGIKKASGTYLLFLNGDDYLINNKVIEENSVHLKNKDLIYFDIIYETENKSRKVTYPDKLNFYFFYTNTICHQAVFFKRELFSKYGFYDENLKIISDWKFIMLAIIKYGVSYAHISNVFCVFDNQGISNTENNTPFYIKLHEEERRKVLLKEFPFLVDDYQEYQLLKYYFKKYKIEFMRNVLRSLKLKLFK
jgi:glycosyltransferase involved in cell wall biosynthesis